MNGLGVTVAPASFKIELCGNSLILSIDSEKNSFQKSNALDIMDKFMALLDRAKIRYVIHQGNAKCVNRVDSIKIMTLQQ